MPKVLGLNENPVQGNKQPSKKTSQNKSNKEKIELQSIDKSIKTNRRNKRNKRIAITLATALAVGVAVAVPTTIYYVKTQFGYEITMVQNGVKTITKVKKGTIIGSLDVPVQAGYTFMGWYTSQTFEEEYYLSENTIIAQDMTIYALMIQNTIAVNYSIDGSVLSIDLPDIDYSDSFTVKDLNIYFAETLADNEYGFLGWYTDVISQELLAEDTQLEENITYYALFEIPYTATFEYVEDTDTYLLSTLTVTNTNATTISLPTTYQGKAVTGISTKTSSSPALTDLNENTNVIIPDSYETIGAYAFYGLTDLTSVTIGNGVTSIGNYAFSSTGLTEIVFPNNVKSLGTYVCYNNTKLVSVIVGDGVTSLEYGAFAVCSNLTSIHLGDGITSLDGFVFYNCTSLLSLIIPNNVTSIGVNVCNGCSSLVDLSIPFTGASSTDTSINGSGTTLFGYLFGSTSYTGSILTSQTFQFKNYILVAEYFIPKTLINVTITGNKIIEYSFSCCTSLTNINIPDSVTSIGSYAFYNCSSLTSVNIPSGVTAINSYTFYGCSSLTSITIPDSVTSIGSSAFEYCYKLVEVYNNSSLTIIAGSINNGYVAEYALGVYGPNDTSNFVTTNDGFVFYVNGDTIYLTNYVGTETDITLPDGYNGNSYEIYKYTFYNNTSITSVTIPDSVTSIGSYAFYRCTGLTSIWIPGSVTTIYASSFSTSPFYNCSSGLIIYCECEESEIPSGWGTYWNYYASSAALTTNYGYSYAAYLAAIGE